MKYLFVCILCCLCIDCKPTEDTHYEAVKILFIGNSLTYYGNMLEMLQDMVNETNPQIKIHQSTFPGYSLDMHFGQIINHTPEDQIINIKKQDVELTLTEQKIKERYWDVIVLQTGTVNVLVPKKREDIRKSISYTKALVNNPNCKFIIFSTWASKTVYPKTYCYNFNKTTAEAERCSPEIKTLEHHVELTNSAYNSLATKHHLIKSNHTNIAYNLIKNDPEINIFMDDIHPNENGAFLNACIFYNLITDKKADQLKYTGNLKKATADILKNIATKT